MRHIFGFSRNARRRFQNAPISRIAQDLAALVWYRPARCKYFRQCVCIFFVKTHRSRNHGQQRAVPPYGDPQGHQHPLADASGKLPAGLRRPDDRRHALPLGTVAKLPQRHRGRGPRHAAGGGGGGGAGQELGGGGEAAAVSAGGAGFILLRGVLSHLSGLRRILQPLRVLLVRGDFMKHSRTPLRSSTVQKFENKTITTTYIVHSSI